MKISNVYIGGWFQRTMLQLSEIYDFLRDCKTQLNLEHEKLVEFRKKLSIGKIEYGVAGEEYIKFTKCRSAPSWCPNGAHTQRDAA